MSEEFSSKTVRPKSVNILIALFSLLVAMSLRKAVVVYDKYVRGGANADSIEAWVLTFFVILFFVKLIILVGLLKRDNIAWAFSVIVGFLSLDFVSVFGLVIPAGVLIAGLQGGSREWYKTSGDSGGKRRMYDASGRAAKFILYLFISFAAVVIIGGFFL